MSTVQPRAVSDPVGSEAASSRGEKQHTKAAVASMIGTTVEWYDFYLFGTAAALIFNKIFFTAIDPITGTLAAFGTYAVGFFARPLGAIIFGHYGDRIGRKSMLMTTLLLMGIPTMLIGLIPPYSSIGYWAAVLLVAMRIVQGIAIGGEWAGAMLMAVEHAPKGLKGFFGSLPQAGVAGGLILSTLAMAAVSRLPEADLLSWGWRIPFLLSFVLVFIGIYIRTRVQESPDFEEVKRSGRQVHNPIMEVLRSHRRAVLTVMGVRVAEISWFFTVVTFSLAYAANTLGIPKVDVLNAITIGAGVMLFTIPLFGAFGDKLGEKTLLIGGLVAMLVYAFFFFQLLGTKNMQWVTLAMVCALGVVFAMIYAVEGPIFSRLFPAEVRYSGMSLAVQASGAIGGGLAPIIATALLAKGGGDPVLISVYLSSLAALGIVSVWLMQDHGAKA